MIKHIVMWSFPREEEQARDEFLRQLLALQGQLEVIKSMQVGVSVNEKNDFDAVLIAEFANMQDLQSYKTDPRHVAVSELCKKIRTKRAAIDFEV